MTVNPCDPILTFLPKLSEKLHEKVVFTRLLTFFVGFPTSLFSLSLFSFFSPFYLVMEKSGDRKRGEEMRPAIKTFSRCWGGFFSLTFTEM